jgi:hypothetical protein
MIPGVRQAIVLAGLGLALVAAPAAGSKATKDVPPFSYAFRITSISVNAKFSHGTESAATTLHLASQPPQRSLTWTGKVGGGMYNGVGNTRVYLAGTITYSGLDPVCTGTVQAAMPRSYSVIASIYLGDARNTVVTHPTLRLEFGKFAIGDIYPGADGKCTNALNFYQYAEDVKPFTIISAPSFTFHAKHLESFTDDAFTDNLKTVFQWTAAVTVHKIRYLKIDCAHSPLC